MKSKPLCVIVDDEEFGLDSLQSKIEELGVLEIERAYLDPDKFLIEVEKLESKIVFLDIEMPISGFEVAKKLKDKLVIIVSGHTDRGVEAFDINAIDFVRKPIQSSRLKEAIHKAISQLKSHSLFVKTNTASKEEISLKSIVYIRTNTHDPRDKMILLLSGKKITAKDITLDALLKLLSTNFIQVNSSVIVNLDYVNKRIDFETMKMDDLKELEPFEFTLGEKFKSAFFDKKPGLK